MSLADYGWNEAWAGRLASAESQGGTPARVLAEHRELFRVHNGTVQLTARISGRLRHDAQSPTDLPAVGDWVLVDQTEEDSEALIHVVLPRLSKFSRRSAGARTEEQIVAANVDTVWIISAFGSDLNPNRIDRYLALAWESGASPVLIITKSDLSEAPDATVAKLQAREIAVPIHAVSAQTGSGLDALSAYLTPGETIALLGSSGVGKSTLLNRLAGREVMQVAQVRTGDGKGRHKTTHRQLVLLPSGALLLDTPGMRELQLWSAEEGFDKSFEDIQRIAQDCRFADCRHETEPDCAVRRSVEEGTLASDRLSSFRKLQKELAYLETKQDVRAEIEKKKRWKSIMKEYRRRYKGKN